MYVARVLSFAVSPRHVFKLLDSVFNFADRGGFKLSYMRSVHLWLLVILVRCGLVAVLFHSYSSVSMHWFQGKLRALYMSSI